MSRRNQHIPMPEFAEHEPNHSLDAQIKRARKNMGEAKWQRLNREFVDPNFIATESSQ